MPKGNPVKISDKTPRDIIEESLGVISTGSPNELSEGIPRKKNLEYRRNIGKIPRMKPEGIPKEISKGVSGGTPEETNAEVQGKLKKESLTNPRRSPGFSSEIPRVILFENDPWNLYEINFPSDNL